MAASASTRASGTLMTPRLRPGQVEARDRLPVHDLAAPDHGERLGERQTGDLGDHLVGLVPLLRLAEPARQEEVDALVAEAGRGEDRPQVRELACLDARLLGQLARRARARRLAGRVEDA